MSRMGIWATMVLAYFILESVGARHWRDLTYMLFGGAVALAINYWSERDAGKQDD